MCIKFHIANESKTIVKYFVLVDDDGGNGGGGADGVRMVAFCFYTFVIGTNNARMPADR